jgi:short-subunit dehydrogenase
VIVESISKTALITGSSSGLGAEFARQLAARGYNLVLTARHEVRLQLLAELVESKYGVQVSIQPADLSKLTDIDRLVSTINSLANLELLVNNAGFGTVGRFHRVDADKELAMVNVHMVAPVILCRAALPGMISRNHGAIINVASLAGLIPIRNVLYYSSKAFLISFTEALHAELRDSQVRVQALCPGFVLTEFHDTVEYSRFLRTSVPRFLWMTSEQVASESLKSLNHRNVICIPGYINRLAGALARNSISAGLIKYASQFVLRRRKTFINS